jgi:hypothetical protein
MTLNTIMHKSVVMTVEWDKRVNKFLYLGTHSSHLKMYDTTQKKIVQEVLINKQFPVVTCITSSPTGRLLVLLTSKTAASKLADNGSKSGQMAICSSATNSIVIEKLLDLDSFFSQSSIIQSDTCFILGKLSPQWRRVIY